jgi:hypothetical protein
MTYQKGDPNHIGVHNDLVTSVDELASGMGVDVDLPPTRQLGDTGHVGDHNTIQAALDKIATEGKAPDADFSNDPEAIYSDPNGGRWKLKTFTTSDTLVVTRAGLLECLIVAGGGGGAGSSGGAYGGGGGAGGVLSFGTFSQAKNGPVYFDKGSYNVTVGAGGAAGNTGGDTGSWGADSRLGYIFAHRGAPGAVGSSSNPFKGGSGGGGGSGGTYITGQGNKGDGGSGGVAGGGGGAGNKAEGVNGGPGLVHNIANLDYEYGEGGYCRATFGSRTFGKGGDGYYGHNHQGQTGGNGIVIVRVRVY